MSNYLAHSANMVGQTETVIEHCMRVANLSAAYTAVWGAEWEGRAAGLMHDLGKYGELFQGVLAGTEKKIDHATPGAYAALAHYKTPALGVALAINAHHRGLTCAHPPEIHKALDLRTGISQDERRFSSPDAKELLRRFCDDGGVLPPAGECQSAEHINAQLPEAAMLDIRMLLSALVDGDYTATAAHSENTIGTLPEHASPPPLEPERALGLVSRHVVSLASSSTAAEDILAIRSELFHACLAAGKDSRGAFTLSAPTGSGKTLAMLAFALQHAATNGHQRVIVVLPFLNIIDQTARTYRRVLKELGEDYLLEDHSLAPEPRSDDGSLRLAAENWRAPLIVTTTVRLFESLFSNRPGDCRKLHNLANSVIMFDEAQTMPLRLAIPTIAVLSQLVTTYRSSVLLATATQPAFTELFTKAETIRPRSERGWQPTEIVSPHAHLNERLRRVHFTWHPTPVAWDDVANEVQSRAQALVIVNLRRHAIELYQRLESEKEGLFHLSTNMCPAHRRDVLAEIDGRLANKQRCIVVSTQCVEAGVDIDFAEVWRAFGPLDAVAQAAGRCNRNGRCPSGEVHVFLPPTERNMYPSAEYEQGAVLLQQMVHGDPGIDPLAHATIQRYFERLYAAESAASRPDEKLDQALRGLDFKEVSRRYRWIGGEGINILVPYAPFREEFDRLANDARLNRLNSKWFRDARKLAVSRRVRDLTRLPAVTETVAGKPGQESGWRILLQEDAYDLDLGLDLGVGPDDAMFIA
jgi:CRISPR-associated endonuclease/helicase Cas3